MGTGTRTDARLRGLGLVAGLAAAAAIVAGGRIPPGDGRLGADVIVAASPRGELGVRPVGPVLTASDLRPGDPADAPSASMDVVNQTGVRLAVHVRGLPSSAQLDGLLWLELEAGGRSLFRGPLGELRRRTEHAFILDPGEGTELTVRAWLPPSATEGYEGRVEQVGLSFEPVPVGGTP
ncbi:MAG TPA: hypothetical protein VNO17_11760 [Actinomycetota bacterium]|nr:hypothetical protein [Actinomycetota bacterium]